MGNKNEAITMSLTIMEKAITAQCMYIIWATQNFSQHIFKLNGKHLHLHAVTTFLHLSWPHSICMFVGEEHNKSTKF